MKPLHVMGSLLVLSCVACSGEAFSDDSDAGAAGVSGQAGASAMDAAPDGLAKDAAIDSSAKDAGAEDATALDAAGDAPKVDADACSEVAFFLDGDGDGYGGTTTEKACQPPDQQKWVTEGGDCDDGNADVHPGQIGFFESGYAKTGSSVVSFDYDCSGSEEEAGASPKAGCHMQGLSCVGGGYLPAEPARSGPGVDPYCGSSTRVNCSVVNLKCSAGAPFAAATIACR